MTISYKTQQFGGRNVDRDTTTPYTIVFRARSRRDAFRAWCLF